MQVAVQAGPMQVISRTVNRYSVRGHYSGRRLEGYAVWNDEANVQVSDMYDREESCLDFISKSRSIIEH